MSGMGGSTPPHCIYVTPDQPSISSTPIVQWDAVSLAGMRYRAITL